MSLTSPINSFVSNSSALPTHKAPSSRSTFFLSYSVTSLLFNSAKCRSYFRRRKTSLWLSSAETRVYSCAFFFVQSRDERSSYTNFNYTAWSPVSYTSKLKCLYICSKRFCLKSFTHPEATSCSTCLFTIACNLNF